MSETLICDGMTADQIKDVAIQEDGQIWVRYVGHVGPIADTILGRLFVGDVAQVEPDKLPFVCSSGEWLPLVHGRCEAKMTFSKQRCIQECAEGKHLCPHHLREEALGKE